MLTLTPTYCSSSALKPSKKFQIKKLFKVSANGFPSFLPEEIEDIKDSFARNLALRIERLPVQRFMVDGPVR
ncbi:Dolichyl-diphosphooligosaccharide--protein glycosyltransferase subunit STT3 [Bienertia sinuspersici]